MILIMPSKLCCPVNEISGVRRTRFRLGREEPKSLIGLDIPLAPFDQRNGIMRRHRLD